MVELSHCAALKPGEKTLCKPAHGGPVDGVCIDRFIACMQATPMVGGSFLCMQV